MHTHRQTHLYTHAHTQGHTPMHTFTHSHRDNYMYTHIQGKHTYTHSLIHRRIHVNTHTQVNTPIHMHTHMRTHSHEHTHFNWDCMYYYQGGACHGAHGEVRGSLCGTGSLLLPSLGFWGSLRMSGVSSNGFFSMSHRPGHTFLYLCTETKLWF